MPRLNLNLIWLAVVTSLLCHSRVDQNVYGRNFADALETIHQRGLEEIDRQDLFNAAVYAMAKEHDQFSSFIPRQDKARYEISLDQKFVGMGASVMEDPEGRGIVVTNTMIGEPHPAHDAGILSGDVIVRVEGESVAGLSTNDVVKKIAGPEGTDVRLSVLAGGEGEPRDVFVRRSAIKIDSVRGDIRGDDTKWRYVLAADERIAYIRLISFGGLSTEEMRAMLTRLKEDDQLHALILDLRDNRGGYLEAAWHLCDMFIADGEIVRTVGRGGKIEKVYSASGDGTFTGFPMAILVNGESASASEIFAACLQHYNRAVIIGERTFGKGSVQQMIPMEQDRSILKLTVARYWPPSGKNIDRRKDSTDEDDWGVRPNAGFEVKLTPEQERERLKLRDERDAFRSGRDDVVTGCIPDADLQLKKAVEYLQAKLDEAAER